MELTVDPRQPVEQSVGSLESGLALDADRQLVSNGRRQDSYSAECECPDDCPRDHGNE